VKISTKHDSIDIEHLKELSLNFGYRMVAERLRAALAQTTKDLVNAATWERARFLQGRIEGLTVALGIPDQLLAEASQTK
jgi:hypothetical protein